MVTKADCAEIRKEIETYGGDTYHIKLHGEDEFKALCFRPSRGKKNARVADEQNRLIRCGNPAGRNTDHLGYGACSRHGGGGKGQTAGFLESNMKTGKSAVKIRSTLRTKIDEYHSLSQGELRDLSLELATAKAIFSELIEDIPAVDDKDFPVAFHRITGLTSTISTLVDKISRIESRDTMTVAQVIYLRAAVSDILMTYITDPEQRELAAKDLVQRVGGGNEYARVLPAGE